MRRIASAFVATVFSFFLAAAAVSDDRFAAIVAAEDYADSLGDVAGASADLAHVAAALEAAGFAVQTFENADQGDIRRAAFWLGENLALTGEDAVGVFYFVGHAAQVDGRTFLLGEDARMGDPIEVAATGLPADLIVEQMQEAANAPNFIVIDASSPVAAAQRLGLDRGVATFDRPDGGMIIFSEYPQETPPGRSDGVSVFAQAFAELVASEETVFRDAVSRLRRTVSSQTDRERRVWVAGRIAQSRFRFTSPDLPSAELRTGVAARSIIRLPEAAMSPGDENAAEDANYHVVEVFFGADRAYERRDGETRFTDEAGDDLAYGVASVSIPPNHVRGELESPAWWRFEFVADPERHVMFQSLELRAADDFFSDVREMVQNSQARQAFVFVHGFNTSYEDGLRRTAQLHHDLNFDGAPIAYLWASRGEATPLAYNRDAVAVDRTAPRLEAFLERVAEETGAERIHVIAHSMGSRALVQALERLAPRSDAALFEQIILAAPDIDRQVFMDIASRILTVGERFTLYASDQDQALEASRRWNGGYARAGGIGEDGIVVVNGLDSIDATAVRTEIFDIGHDYISDQQSILDDVAELLATGSAPPERTRTPLEERAAPTGETYWAIAEAADR